MTNSGSKMEKRSSLRIESGMESSMVVRGWSNLPSDVIELILEKLHFNFVDVIRFGAVCKPWHDISVMKLHNSLPPQLPWLLLSSLDTEIETPFRFLNITDNRIYTLPPPPYPSTTRYTSTVNGWLFILEKDKTCSLVNPVTRQHVVLSEVDLPQLWRYLFLSKNRQNFISKFPEECAKSLMRKVVFSSPPNNNNDCLVMAITRDKSYPLLFWKVGVMNWNRVFEEHWALSYELYQDAIYFKGQFYAVDSYGRIVACNLTCSSPVTEQIEPAFPRKFENTYLVDVLGELVFIARFKHKRSQSTSFHLYRQDPFSKEWIRVETIGDHAIFLGYNQSVSLLASNYSGCKANCIYFNSYDFEKAEVGDCGIFNLADGLVEPLPCFGNSELATQFPVWIATSLG